VDDFNCPCPACGQCLIDADVTILGGVPASRDPQGEARFDLLFVCCNCEAEFTAFLPTEALVASHG
jgi:hypothetical protein